MTDREVITFENALAFLNNPTKTERLAALWAMSPAERVAAMRRGELTYMQLAAWSARYPDEVPRLNGEFEWIAIKTPEVAEASD
jgi:hypothetical protein